MRGAKNKINLTSQMYVARGGQAEIFGTDSTIFKVYHNRKDAIPYSKIQQLESHQEFSFLTF